MSVPFGSSVLSLSVVTVRVPVPLGSKAGATIAGSDFKGLCELARTAGARFVGGVVLYDG